jgi:mono/diheme cytochrome c family protein
MKVASVTLVLVSTVGLLGYAAAFADPRRDTILADLLAQARQAEPGFTGFSAERGAALHQATHTGGKQGTGSCTACHGTSPQGTGQTRARKTIEPMAVSKHPARYTDKATVEKWFTRNCQDVLGRACTAKEKGDFLTYMMGQ